MPFSKGRAVDAANKAMKRGQYGKAVSEYQRIVKQDPNDIRAKLKLGDLYIRAGETEAAVEVLREVAEHYSHEGFTLKAVAVLKQILKLSPELADVSVTLAAHLHQQGLVNEAVRQYKDAARIYGQRGHTLERLEVIRQMVELDPDNVSDRIRLAESFSGSGRYSEAVALFRDACRILEKRDRPQLYCKVAERLLHHQPDDFQINRQLATYYLKDRDAQRSLPKLRACYRQQPRDLDVLDMLQETFDLLGQPHKAVSVLREMARIYEENGLLKERDQTFERILLINSSDSEARKALRIVTAVGEQSLVLEFDESGPKRAQIDASTDEDLFEEVDLDEEILFDDVPIAGAAKSARTAATAAKPAVATAKPAAGAAKPAAAAAKPAAAAAKPAAAAAKPAAAAAKPAAGAAKPAAGAAKPAAGAARPEAVTPLTDTVRDGTLDEIFGELDLDDEIDIQEDGEDTIVVGEMAIGDFDEFQFDDEIQKASDLGRKMAGGAGGKARKPAPAAAAAAPAKKGRGAELQDDWKALFSDDAGADQDIQAAFGRVEGEVDLKRLMAEAEDAVTKGAAATAGVDLALQESLEEVDFYVSNELHEDAVQLLEELQNEYPGHPEVRKRMKALGKA